MRTSRRKNRKAGQQAERRAPSLIVESGLYTLEQAARLGRVGQDRLREAMRQGKVRHAKNGRRYMICGHSLREWLLSMR